MHPEPPKGWLEEHLDCDDRALEFGERIVGGRNARTGDAPFHVSLRNLFHERRYGFGSGLFCGGSLISADLVLTAAHCFTTTASNMGVVAGILNRFDQSPRMQFRRAFRYLRHPRWNPRTLYADIGLVALQSPFLFSVPLGASSIRPIVPTNNGPVPGERCTIFGWGQTQEGRNRLQPVCLQKADVTIFEQTRCNRSLSVVINVPDGTFCAGRYAGGVDSCQRDSGGPLVCGDGALYGVVSFGWGCGRAHAPGVYTDVFRYRQWIDAATGSDPRTWSGAVPVADGRPAWSALLGGIVMVGTTVRLS
uniref:Peptidase S1 domain-containing protein n=1 Tax=Anopheles dirus TaxID=7168 RepID=A0A182NME6_9DIPT